MEYGPNLLIVMDNCVGVLGGGVSGLTFAYLVKNAEVLEKSSSFGGLCRSINERGYTFDLGSHIVFSNKKEILGFMLNLLGNDRVEHKRNAKILYKGRFIKYPFENGLGELPKLENLECLFNYSLTNLARTISLLKKPQNFKDWMEYRFGTAITQKYLYPYNAKIWDFDPAQMHTFWIENRLPQPHLIDLVRSSLGLTSEGYLHQLYFYYPSRGGYQQIVNALAAKIGKRRIINNFNIQKIKKEGRSWIVRSADAQEKCYDQLVSTIHIRDFLRSYQSTPREVLEAAEKLKWNSIYLVMLGLKKPKQHDIHWVYVPQKDLLPNRISFPSNYSPNMAPAGYSSLLAEVTFDPKGKKASLGENKIQDIVTEQLSGLGLFDKNDITFAKTITLPYAYVVYDLDYLNNIKKIEDFAAREGITLVGRFSEFRYYNTDACIESVMKKAKPFI